jgi:hypothetical protein
LRFNLPQPGVSIIRAAPQFCERSNAIKRIMRAWLKPRSSTSASAAASDVVAPGQLDVTGHGLGDGGGHGGRLRCGLGGRRPGGLQFLDVRLLRRQFLPEIVSSEDPWNAGHINQLPVEIRNALARMCGSPHGAHYFATYFENSRVIKLHFEKFLCGGKEPFCTPAGCLHQTYVLTGSRYRLSRSYYAPGTD